MAQLASKLFTACFEYFGVKDKSKYVINGMTVSKAKALHYHTMISIDGMHQKKDGKKESWGLSQLVGYLSSLGLKAIK